MNKNLIQVCSMLSLLFVMACGSGGNSSICGNGIVESGEACDDGNQLNGDACSAACKASFQSQSQSLGQQNGEIQYLQVGKLDQKSGLDLLVLNSQNQQWSFDSYSSFLTNSSSTNIDSFSEVSDGPNGSITRKLTSYDVADVNGDGLLDLVYFLITEEPLPDPNQYKLSMNLNYLRNVLGNSFSPANLLHPSVQEEIIEDGDLSESGLFIDGIKIAEFGDSEFGLGVIFNSWIYNKHGIINSNKGTNYYLEKIDQESFKNLAGGIVDQIPYGSKFVIGRLDQSDANWEVLYTDTRIFALSEDSLLEFSSNTPVLNTSALVKQVALQDLNGDNLNDLVVLTNNELLWTENLGVPSFGSLKSISTQPITHIETGDLDRDGLGDILAFSSANGGEILYFHNEGGGMFNTGSLLKNTGTITAQHLVDADEDGDLDLVYAVGSELFFLENQI